MNEGEAYRSGDPFCNRSVSDLNSAIGEESLGGNHLRLVKALSCLAVVTSNIPLFQVLLSVDLAFIPRSSQVLSWGPTLPPPKVFTSGVTEAQQRQISMKEKIRRLSTRL